MTRQPAIAHGTILGGVVVVPDVDAALADYRGRLGLVVVADDALRAELAASWGCPASAGARCATLQPASGAPCFIRLVEQPDHRAFRPTRSYGWAAYELTVQDVFSWPDRLTDSGFTVVGPPKAIAGMDAFIPMQVLGRGQEMLYLNEVQADMAGTDLPRAQSQTDHIFIVILAAPDRLASVRWYADVVGLTATDHFTIAYTMINRAFDLPPDTLTTLTMMQQGRMPIIEVDDYPATATIRPRHADMLPPGNALVTLAVPDLAALSCAWLTPPARHPDAIYGGRRSATTIGPAGELVELVEYVEQVERAVRAAPSGH